MTAHPVDALHMVWQDAAYRVILSPGSEPTVKRKVPTVIKGITVAYTWRIITPHRAHRVWSDTVFKARKALGLFDAA